MIAFHRELQLAVCWLVLWQASCQYSKSEVNFSYWVTNTSCMCLRAFVCLQEIVFKWSLTFVGGQASFKLANSLLKCCLYTHCELKQITTHNGKTFTWHKDTHGTVDPAKGVRHQYGMLIVSRQSIATSLHIRLWGCIDLVFIQFFNNHKKY